MASTKFYWSTFLLLLLPQITKSEWSQITPKNASAFGVEVKQLQLKYGDMWCHKGVGVTISIQKSLNGSPITDALLGVKNRESMQVLVSAPVAIPADDSSLYICLSEELIQSAILSVSYGETPCGPKEHLSIQVGEFVEIQKP